MEEATFIKTAIYLEGDILKVLMVTPGFYPIRGGTESMVRNLSIKLNRTGIQTHVMTFNMDRKWKPRWRGEVKEVDGLKVFKVPALKLLPSSPRINMNVNLIPGIFMNIMKCYDIIHFHEADLSFPVFSFFVKKPKLLHLHGIDFNFLKKYHLYRLMFKHVSDYYIAITNEMKKNLIEIGISRDRIIYLPNAIDVKFFSSNRNVKKEENMLLFVGRITHIKGLHVLLKALHYLKKPSHLVIIGPIWDLTYYNGIVDAFVKRINQEGRHKVTYLGAPDDILEWYQKAAIFILPSYWEAFPVVLLEALACGTPVVATSVGGIPEIIQNHQNGILIPPNNPLKLAEAIQYLMDNEDIRIRMSKEGREYVMRNFSLDVVVKKLCKIYRNILDANKNKMY